MLFTRADLEAALVDLVQEIGYTGADHSIYVVGGAAIMLQVGRVALTQDIDTLHLANPEIHAAAARVAQARRLPTTRLNDAAKMWMSHFDTEADWKVVASSGSVTVLAARPPLLLAMKLLAGRGRRDAVDIDLLLEACDVADLAEAERLFDRYYPTESIAPRARRQLLERFSPAPGDA